MGGHVQAKESPLWEKDLLKSFSENFERGVGKTQVVDYLTL